MRLKFAALTIIAAAFAFVTVAAQAAPIAPPKGATSKSEQVIKTAGGCGRFRHRNWRGVCVRN